MRDCPINNNNNNSNNVIDPDRDQFIISSFSLYAGTATCKA